MKSLHIDIETYCDLDLSKVGVYKYAAHDSFEILLFAYAVDEGPVQVVDLAKGEKVPVSILEALLDKTVKKFAFNAVFERVCLSSFLAQDFLPPEQWCCTMVWAAACGLPLSLQNVGTVLAIDKGKLDTGKALIRKFCQPVKNGEQWRRTLPKDAPESWEEFKKYCLRDVEAEKEIANKLKAFPLPSKEWDYYADDQHINDTGVGIDTVFVKQAIDCSTAYNETLIARAKELTGLENPNSPMALKEWLQSQGVSMESMTKKEVARALADAANPVVQEVLQARLELAKTSIKKYEAMRSISLNGRGHGLLQFMGAGRTGRYAGRLVQVQNLPRNYLPDLDQARRLVKSKNFEALELLYPSVPDVLSQLIRTAFIPDRAYGKFAVIDYSAIEARILAWLAGEIWRLELFMQGGDIYCQSAEKMFKVPVEKHGVNGYLRQKGKIAELACGYGGSVGALKAMGALDMGLAESELKPIVDAWRQANPNIVKLWKDIDGLCVAAVSTQRRYSYNGLLEIGIAGDALYIQLPSGRRLHYLKPRMNKNRYGKPEITYMGTDNAKRWSRISSYGPKFVENIVQGIARDLLAEALHKICATNYRIVMHVHDEIVCEIPKKDAQKTLQHLKTLMCTQPNWAFNLPLDADGYICDYYKKD